eukprot:scaffold10079_cov113-Isochrysis_galbana.AAC.3
MARLLRAGAGDPTSAPERQLIEQPLRCLRQLHHPRIGRVTLCVDRRRDERKRRPRGGQRILRQVAGDERSGLLADRAPDQIDERYGVELLVTRQLGRKRVQQLAHRRDGGQREAAG